MKTILWCAVLSCSTALSTLTAQTANVNIFALQDVHFYVYLDGKLQHTDPKKNVRVLDVPEGSYTIKLEFYNAEIPPVQTYATLKAKKESAFMLNLEGKEGASFNEYSCVPKEEVNVQVGTSQHTYSREGLAKNPNAKVEEKTEIYKGMPQYGVLSQADIDARRMGQTRIVEGNGGDNAPTSAAPNTATEPVRENGKTEEVTEVKNYKVKTDELGNQKILCERLITTKTTVYDNGVEMVGTNEVKRTGTTPFTCLPKGDLDFAPIPKAVESATDRLAAAKKQTEGQCLAPDQLTALANLLTNDADKQAYAAFAKPFCAHPTEYPLQAYLPAMVIAKVDTPTVQPDTIANNTNTIAANTTDTNNTTTTTNTSPGEEPKGKGKGGKGKKPKKEKAPKKPKKATPETETAPH